MADQLPSLPSDSWDLVVAFDVLEHIDQDAIIDLLRAIRQLLRPGGVFIARFPNGDSPLGLQIQHGDITHITTLGSGKIEYFAKTLGFELIFLRGSAQPICGINLIKSFRRLIIVPIKIIFERLIRNLLFPGTRVAYLSSSLVVCLRKS